MKYVLYLLLCKGGCASNMLGIGPRLVSMSPHLINCCLTPKLLWLVFRLFLEFGQAILVRVLILNF